MALVLSLGLVLRLHRLGAQPLWLDEADTYAVASRPSVSDVLERVEPPLHPMLLHFWLKLGASDGHARLLSAVVGVATVVLFYALGAALLGPTVGAAAAFLLAVNPYHVWYSQEARMYATYLFWGTAATLLLWRAVVRPSARRWIAYGAALVLVGLSHATALLLAMAHGVFVLLRRSRQPGVLGGFVATAAVVGVVLFPIALRFFTAAGGGAIAQQDKPLTLATLPYLFFVQSVGTTLGPSIYEIQRNTSLSVIAPYWPVVVLALAVFLPLFLLGVVATWRRDRDVWWLLALVATVPILASFVLDALLPGATLNPRHVIVCLIGYLGFVAAGLSALPRVGGAVATVAVTVVSAISLANLYWNPAYAKEDAPGAAAYLRSLDGADAVGLVIHYPWPIEHYYRGAIRLHGSHGLGEPSDPGLEARLRALVADHDQLVVIHLREWHYDPDGRVDALCDRLFTRLDERTLHGVRIVRYGLTPEAASVVSR